MLEQTLEIYEDLVGQYRDALEKYAQRKKQIKRRVEVLCIILDIIAILFLIAMIVFSVLFSLKGDTETGESLFVVGMIGPLIASCPGIPLYSILKEPLLQLDLVASDRFLPLFYDNDGKARSFSNVWTEDCLLKCDIQHRYNLNINCWVATISLHSDVRFMTSIYGGDGPAGSCVMTREYELNTPPEAQVKSFDLETSFINVILFTDSLKWKYLLLSDSENLLDLSFSIETLCYKIWESAVCASLEAVIDDMQRLDLKQLLANHKIDEDERLEILKKTVLTEENFSDKIVKSSIERIPEYFIKRDGSGQDVHKNDGVLEQLSVIEDLITNASLENHDQLIRCLICEGSNPS